MSGHGIRLFALGTERAFREGVAAGAGVEIAPHEERAFEDGEHKARPLVSVRGADVFVLDSLHGDARRSANDRLCRMLFFVATVRDAGAASVTAVAPYLCYARKDRRTKPRDPVTTRYVAALFEAAGIDAIVSMDVHNLAAYQNAFRARAEHLEARPVLARHLAAALAGHALAVVSPDAGGVKRAEALRATLQRALGQDVVLAFLEKHRSEDVVSGSAVVGDVRGRTAVIVDDLVSSGTTLARAARACRARGAEGVWAAVTHGLFTASAADVIADDALDRVVVTNTVPPFRLPADLLSSKVTVLDAAPLLGAAIRRLHEGGSLVALIAEETPVSARPVP